MQRNGFGFEKWREISFNVFLSKKSKTSFKSDLEILALVVLQFV